MKQNNKKNQNKQKRSTDVDGDDDDDRKVINAKAVKVQSTEISLCSKKREAPLQIVYNDDDVG